MRGLDMPLGIGIVERLNRTFTYELIFHHEANLLADLRGLAEPFRQWYNEERLHSRLDYQTPA